MNNRKFSVIINDPSGNEVFSCTNMNNEDAIKLRNEMDWGNGFHVFIREER